jgi:hypothetical protein
MKRQMAGLGAPNVVATGPGRGTRTRWLIAVVAAALGALIWMGVMKRQENERPSRPTARARAQLLRDDAMQECAEARWSECKISLDAARRLDPTGEDEARVIEARRHLAASPAAPGSGQHLD